MDCSEDKIPKGYTLLKRTHRYIKAFVPVSILGKKKVLEDGVV